MDVNGDDGGRDITIPAKDLYRLIFGCFHQNTLKKKIKMKYFHILFVRKVKKKFNVNLEVINCGTLLDLLQNIETKPDMVILHAYNDIRSYLTNNFKPDYYTVENLVNYYKFYLGSLIPYVPINFINYFVNNGCH